MVGGTWPMVGRTDELAAIDAASLSGEPGGVVLVGAMGVGKSRLVREALERARLAGRAVERVAATRSAATIPFGAVLGLLPAEGAFPGEPFELMRQTVDHLAQRSQSAPVVVGIDDAHLLDDGSAALVHHLILRRAAFLVASVRAGEPVPDAVAALWKDGLAGRLRVRPLPAAVMDTLITRALGTIVEGATRQHIRQVSSGNPLVLRELLAGAQDDEALVLRDEIWRWKDRPRYGSSLVEIVEGRLAVLGDAGRTVLEVVACGEPLPAHLLNRLVEGGALEAAAVEAAERRGIIGCEQVGSRQVMRPGHPIYGEIVRATLPRAKASTIWRWLADAAGDQPMRRRDDALTLTGWQLNAGMAPNAQALLTAARLAAARADLALAERFARAARGAGAGARGGQVLARILTWQGRHGEAWETLPTTPSASGGRRGAADWAATRAWSRHWSRGGTSEAMQALDNLAGDAAADGARAWLLLFGGDCRGALDRVAPVFDAIGADCLGPATTWPFPLAAAAHASALHGRTDAALTLADRGLAVLPRDGEGVWERAVLGWSRCLALLLAGRTREAGSVASDGYLAVVGATAATDLTAGWASYRGRAALAQGRVVTAQAALREAWAMLCEYDPCQFRRYVLSGLACATALTGDQAAADEWMRRADGHRADANRMFEPWIELDRAWVIAAHGDLTSAAEQAGQAAALARSGAQHAVEAIALYDVARLGQPRSVLDRLTKLAEVTDRSLTPVLGSAAAALASGDPVAMNQQAARLAELGLFLHGAEMATAAGRALPGRGRSAPGAVGPSLADLTHLCEGARSPLLPGVLVTPDLTPREREIALLAASGLTSKTIAATLHLSERTVSNHLARTYAKAGISSRSELPAILRTNGKACPGRAHLGLSGTARPGQRPLRGLGRMGPG